MKKIFQIIGVVSLTIFSFYMTEKTSLMVKNMDEIMISINENKDNFKKDSIDAVIDGDKIIPGVRERVVNVKKSYKNMKQNGFYDEKLYIYDYKDPKISLNNNKDKSIIKGNPSKRMISFIFKLKGNINIDNILKILSNYNINSSFFVDYEWFNSNSDLISKMISSGHIVEPLPDDSNYYLMYTILKKLNKNMYCYISDLKNKIYDDCIVNQDYLILPKEVQENKPLIFVKENLESGLFFSFNVNSFLKKELSSIIIYIKSKGYQIVDLDSNILE